MSKKNNTCVVCMVALIAGVILGILMSTSYWPVLLTAAIILAIMAGVVAFVFTIKTEKRSRQERVWKNHDYTRHGGHDLDDYASASQSHYGWLEHGSWDIDDR